MNNQTLADRVKTQQFTFLNTLICYSGQVIDRHSTDEIVAELVKESTTGPTAWAFNTDWVFKELDACYHEWRDIPDADLQVRAAHAITHLAYLANVAEINVTKTHLQNELIQLRDISKDPNIPRAAQIALDKMCQRIKRISS